MADRVRPQSLEVAYPNAAGIDIGSASHFVAVRPDADDTPVRDSAVPDKSVAAMLSRCALRKVDHDVRLPRSGAGSMPCSRSTFAIVPRPTCAPSSLVPPGSACNPRI